MKGKHFKLKLPRQPEASNLVCEHDEGCGPVHLTEVPAIVRKQFPGRNVRHDIIVTDTSRRRSRRSDQSTSADLPMWVEKGEMLSAVLCWF